MKRYYNEKADKQKMSASCKGSTIGTVPDMSCSDQQSWIHDKQAAKLPYEMVFSGSSSNEKYNAQKLSNTAINSLI